MFHVSPAGDGYACQLRLFSDSSAAITAGSLRQLGDTFTAPLYSGMSFCFFISVLQPRNEFDLDMFFVPTLALDCFVL